MSQGLRVRAGLVVLVLGLTGCTNGAGSDPEATPKPAAEQFAELAGVVHVTPDTNSVMVTVGSDASDDEVLEAATSIASIATEAEFDAPVLLERENVDPFDEAQDVSTRSPWTLQVFPADEGTLDDLADVLELDHLGITTNLVVIDGWPYATVDSVDGLADSFGALAANGLFADGGTVSQGDEHLRIVWVPTRTSQHAIDEIIAIAATYPGAEVLLEATTAGPQWPTLYIARISAEEATAIEGRLLDPSLADADVDGYGLPFILTTIGADGPVYLEGNLGGVVEG